MGRKKELDELHSTLQKNKTVFVTGIAGIGKSELVRQYARIYKNNYVNIIYLTYENNLEYTIAHMYLKDEDLSVTEKQLFDSHYHIMQGLDNNDLVIIDNFNTLPEENKLLRKFVNHRFKTIFTTRMHVKGFPALGIAEINDTNALSGLFQYYYPYAPKEKDTIQAIIHEIHSHTLTVELVARTLQVSSVNPQDLLTQLITNGLHIRDTNEITITKDEEDRTAVMYQHIKTLFDMHNLDSELIDSLMHFCLIPSSGVDKDIFSLWRNKNHNNDISKLVRLGWINEDEIERKLYIHPIIQEVVREETNPSTIKCRIMLDIIHTTCLAHGIDIHYYQMLFSTIMSIIDKIFVDDMPY